MSCDMVSSGNIFLYYQIKLNPIQTVVVYVPWIKNNTSLPCVFFAVISSPWVEKLTIKISLHVDVRHPGPFNVFHFSLENFITSDQANIRIKGKACHSTIMDICHFKSHQESRKSNTLKSVFMCHFVTSSFDGLVLIVNFWGVRWIYVLEIYAFYILLFKKICQSV